MAENGFDKSLVVADKVVRIVAVESVAAAAEGRPEGEVEAGDFHPFFDHLVGYILVGLHYLRNVHLLGLGANCDRNPPRASERLSSQNSSLPLVAGIVTDSVWGLEDLCKY